MLLMLVSFFFFLFLTAQNQQVRGGGSPAASLRANLPRESFLKCLSATLKKDKFLICRDFIKEFGVSHVTHSALKSRTWW